MFRFLRLQIYEKEMDFQNFSDLYEQKFCGFVIYCVSLQIKFVMQASRVMS